MSTKPTTPSPLQTAPGSSISQMAVGKQARSGDVVLGHRNKEPLCLAYPVNTVMELKMSPGGEIVRGLVYTTDEISNSIVLKRSLTHTTLASEVRILNAASVLEKKIIQVAGTAKGPAATQSGADGSAAKQTNVESGGNNADVYANLDVASPLPAVNKKALEERERRALRLAEESFGHINQKATPEGQAVFDRLLKACNEVVWRDESIFVLNQIRVDPPYGKDDCKLLTTGSGTGSLNEGSLDRVKKIVAAAASERS